MKISIITVTYNSQDTIERTIKSVLSQTYENIEFIIIDGESNDDTLSIIESYKHEIDYFISESDDGIYDAMNKGINIASGDVVHFLNSDDFYVNSIVIESLMKEFSEHVDIIISPVSMVDSCENVLYDFKPCLEDPFKCIPHQGFYYKRTIHKTFGLYSTFLRYASDYNFYLNIKDSYQMREFPSPTVFMQIDGAGVSEGFFVLSELFYVQVKNKLPYYKALRRFSFLLLKNKVRLSLDNTLLKNFISELRYYFRRK